MEIDLRAYRRRDYVRKAYRTNLKWGKEMKKLRKIITRIMESQKENADCELYLDLLCLRTYKVDPFLILKNLNEIASGTLKKWIVSKMGIGQPSMSM